MFSLLSDQYRRDVLSVLPEENTSVPLEEIADAIASGRASIDEPDSPDQVVAALHHVHLPKLDDADVVSYDTETKTVTPERVDALVPYVGSESDEA